MFVAVLSKFRMAPGLTVAAMVGATIIEPLPLKLVVPPKKVRLTVGVAGCAVVKFSVPLPNFCRAEYWFAVAVAAVRLLFTLIVPAPIKEIVRAVVVELLIPPLIFRMPDVAPMAAPKFSVITPVVKLVPEKFSNCPPKLTPPTRTSLVP